MQKQSRTLEHLMALGRFFKSLLGINGTSSKTPAAPVDYKEFSIEAAPIDEGGKFRTAGFISGEFEGEIRRIPFVRADQNADSQAAIDHSLVKARQIIDEQGDQLLTKTQL